MKNIANIKLKTEILNVFFLSKIKNKANVSHHFYSVLYWSSEPVQKGEKNIEFFC